MSKSGFSKRINALLVPLLATISGLILSAVILLLSNHSPIEAFSALINSGFSCTRLNNCNFFQTLQLATPLILNGLSATVAFRSGVFSIGQEGQFLIGAIMAAWLGYAIHLPPVIHQIVLIAAAVLAAGFYGWIPGILKVKLNINEVITTVMMNNIAILFMAYVVNFPMNVDKGATARSAMIDLNASLPAFFQGSKWGAGFVVAILVSICVYFYIWRSTPGYEQRMSGQSSLFARFGGIKTSQAVLRGMVISGGLAGMAGAIEVMGVHHRIMQGFSTGLGFDGVMVALLGQTHPVGVLIVGILFAGVRLGAQIGLQTSMQIPRELGGVIIALIILFVSADTFFKDLIHSIRNWLGNVLSHSRKVE
jgi:ABC-type uncharacterized transport system permease subunit